MDLLVTTATLPGRLDAGISVSTSVHPVRSTHPTETAVSSVPEISSSRSEWDSSARTRGLFDYPLVTPVSHSAGTTQELGMTNLSVTAAPYFSTGVRSIGTLPPHSGVHTAGLAEHRVSWSMSGERPLQFIANFDSLRPQQLLAACSNATTSTTSSNPTISRKSTTSGNGQSSTSNTLPAWTTIATYEQVQWRRHGG